MPWPVCSLETVRALVRQSRMDTAMDADGDGQMTVYFGIYHAGVTAGIRSKVSQGGHTLDANALSVPPEFDLLVGLRIAALMLGRPGSTDAGSDGALTLTREQRDLVKQLELQLEGVAGGKAVTATDNPETVQSTTNASGNAAAVVRPGIGYDQSFQRLGTS